ncbi:MAG: bifunctional rhamnulose-1-phosphate aldolase/short-chain dehydrogenase, partial [Acidimicrobiales bacterium]
MGSIAVASLYESPTEVAELLERAHFLGSDPTTTNYAGGNASVKASVVDPSTGLSTEIMWVKGSGGDLGTLTEAGLAVLRVDALRGLRQTYRGEAFEDEMVAAFDFCLFGRGG